MKYFTIAELTKSSVASRLGIKNIPNSEEKKNLQELVKNILDPLREAYGKPIIVTSGFRCTQLNKIVGGSSTSQHLLGQAVDIRSVQDTVTENRKLYDLIISLNLPFDQLINEFTYDWVHVSYGPRHRKMQLRTSKSENKTVYITVK